jgi:hypothetical protein
MASCDLCYRCFFFNEPLIDNLSSNAEFLREKYCAGDFAECAIYNLAKSGGIEKVSGYVYPDDFLEDLKTNLLNVSQPQGGINMFIKVIYPDGTLGTERSLSVGYLMKLGKIVAFQCSEGWVEARRKQNNEDFFGRERRRSNSPIVKSR